MFVNGNGSSSASSQHVPLGGILQKVGAEGITREEFEKIEHKLVATRVTVGELINATISTGGFEWREDLLVLASSKGQ